MQIGTHRAQTPKYESMYRRGFLSSILAVGAAATLVTGVIGHARKNAERLREFSDWYTDAVESGELDLTHFSPGESGNLEQVRLPGSATQNTWKPAVLGGSSSDLNFILSVEPGVATVGDNFYGDDKECIESQPLAVQDLRVFRGVDVVAYEGDFANATVSVNEANGVVELCSVDPVKFIVSATSSTR